MPRSERQSRSPERERQDALDTANARARLLAALPLHEHRRTLAGIETAVLEGGEGPPVVLLHGPSGYAAHWARIIPTLIARHRVVAPDLPAHGATGIRDAALNAERIVQWLQQLIGQTCATPPALVGQLLGGAIAARFAIEHPELLDHLVLVDAFGLQTLQPAPEFMLAVSRFQSDPNARTHEQLWQLCVHDLPALRRQMGELWAPFQAYNVERARVPELQAGLQQLMREFAFEAIPKRDLERIACPTTLIWGRHDLATPLAVAENASAEYGWPLHVIENANDDPAIDQPDAFSRALASALAQPRKAAGGRS